MIGIVLVSHGDLAEAALCSLESVLGHPVPALAAVGARSDDSLTSLKERIGAAVQSVEQGQGTVIFTDMFGDSAANVSIALAREAPVQVVTGANLPILLKAISARHSMDLETLASFVVDYGRDHILRVSPGTAGPATKGSRPPR